MKKIVDVCCDSRMFWFDRHNENTVYMDKRREEHILSDGRKLIVNPDIIADFTDMPFEDETFHLVVFDPPHLKKAGENSWLKKKYGRLPKDWQPMIADGFRECWRILKPSGTLIFKWSEHQISVADVKKILPYKPLLGNRRGKTVWLVFFKNGE